MLSVFRREITKEIARQFREEYKLHPNQWGFLRMTNTDVAKPQQSTPYSRAVTI